MQQFEPIVELCCERHRNLAKIAEFWRQPECHAVEKNREQEFSSCSVKNWFPIKVSIPVNFALKASMNLVRFDMNANIDDQVFQIPGTYDETDRSSQMKAKTTGRQKKRTMYTNMYL